MLDLKVEGDTHPKTFKLVTDDADGELARLADIFGECDLPEGDEARAWFDNATADQFREEGVTIPEGEIADFAELLEGDWPEAYEKFEAERRDAMEKAEAALSGDDE